MCADRNRTATATAGSAATTTAPEGARTRAKCPTCGGLGRCLSSTDPCGSCDGTGHATHK